MNEKERELEENDPLFLEDLRESKIAVGVAASWLKSWGYSVVVKPTLERPTVEERLDYADDGDLEIVQRVEVKRRKGLTFTSLEDFPYETIIVDVCHTYDNAKPKPYAYLILNREMTKMIVVKGKTKRHWKKVNKFDKFRKRNRNYYECPLSLVTLETIK